LRFEGSVNPLGEVGGNVS